MSSRYFFLLISLALYSCSAKVEVPELEARDLGGKALSRYCAREGLSHERFVLNDIGPAGDFPWMLVYISSGIAPAQEVIVSIDKHGRVETSRGIKP